MLWSSLTFLGDKTVYAGAAGTDQQLRALASLGEDLSSIPSTQVRSLTTPCNSSCRRADTLSGLLRSEDAPTPAFLGQSYGNELTDIAFFGNVNNWMKCFPLRIFYFQFLALNFKPQTCQTNFLP